MVRGNRRTEKCVKWTTFHTFLRKVNFILMFSRRVSFPFKCGEAIFRWSRSSMISMKLTPHGDTDFSKLVNFYPVLQKFPLFQSLDLFSKFYIRHCLQPMVTHHAKSQKNLSCGSHDMMVHYFDSKIGAWWPIFR